MSSRTNKIAKSSYSNSSQSSFNSSQSQFNSSYSSRNSYQDSDSNFLMFGREKRNGKTFSEILKESRVDDDPLTDFQKKYGIKPVYATVDSITTNFNDEVDQSISDQICNLFINRIC